jgi:hypothetical protein
MGRIVITARGSISEGSILKFEAYAVFHYGNAQEGEEEG